MATSVAHKKQISVNTSIDRGTFARVKTEHSTQLKHGKSMLSVTISLNRRFMVKM